jgi:hypothetical protein
MGMLIILPSSCSSHDLCLDWIFFRRYGLLLTIGEGQHTNLLIGCFPCLLHSVRHERATLSGASNATIKRDCEPCVPLVWTFDV